MYIEVTWVVRTTSPVSELIVRSSWAAVHAKKMGELEALLEKEVIGLDDLRHVHTSVHCRYHRVNVL